MNNQKTLYFVIVFLLLLNVATIAYFVGRNQPFSMMPGYRNMMGNFNNDEDFLNKMWEFMNENNEQTASESEHALVDYNKPVVETHKNTFDFGQIEKTNGIVSTTFKIENHGKKPLIIGEISTSCGCTSAEVDKNEVGFDEITTLTVHFDPNFHDEPIGKITRSVFVETNDPNNQELQFDIYVEILEG